MRVGTPQVGPAVLISPSEIVMTTEQSLISEVLEPVQLIPRVLLACSSLQNRTQQGLLGLQICVCIYFRDFS